MPSVNQASGTQSTCTPKDTTPPPTPTIHRSRAFERASDRATWVNSNPSPVTGRRPDPAYFELHNVEPGTTIQLINISKKPDASFDEKESIVELKLTGRDVQNRQAAIYLTQEQLDKIDLKGGDIYRLRVVDAAGNASEVVTNELEPDDWGNRRLSDLNAAGNGWEIRNATTENMLDGESTRKNVIIKTVNDGRAPLLTEAKIAFDHVAYSDEDRAVARTLLDNAAAIKTALGKDAFNADEIKANAKNDALSPEVRAAFEKLSKDPALYARFDKAIQVDGVLGTADFHWVCRMQSLVVLGAELAIEPRSRVRVQNTRTGESFEANVGDDQKLKLNVPNALDGDTLLVTPFDNENHEGKTLEFRLSAGCDKGYAPKLDILGARLGGVI